jgi:YgiT-type zinc finger domain-containing protein
VYYHSSHAYYYHGLSADAPKVDIANAAENSVMKCSILGCPGEYESKLVTHTVRHRGRVVVIDHVPANVCAICGDVLLDSSTIRRIEHLLANLPQAVESAPLYEFAAAGPD